MGRLRAPQDIESDKDNKAQVSALLDRVATGPLRRAIDDEAVALTALGNGLQIRHFETSKVAVSDDEVDYLFGRMATLMLYILRRTGRLKI